VRQLSFFASDTVEAPENAMFRWQRLRSSKTAVLTSRHAKSKGGVTRRVVVGTAATAAVGGIGYSAGIFEQAALEIEEIPSGLVVVTGPHRWNVTRDCFGPSARLIKVEESGRAGFIVRGAKFPGTELTFDLDCKFERMLLAPFGSWRLLLRCRGLPFRTSVPFIPWLLGNTHAETEADAAAATSLVTAVTRGAASVRRPAKLRFNSTLSWRIEGSARALSLESVSLKADAAVITTAAAGQGLFEDLLDAPPSALSTCILFESISGNTEASLHVGHTDGTELRLVPDRINAVALQIFEERERTSVLGTSGTFRALVKRAGSEVETEIETSDGTVLAIQQGRRIFCAASLPISENPHLVWANGHAFTIHGEDDSHRLEAEARDGRLISFRARGAITNFPVAMPGADYSRLDFSGTDALISLGDLPHPDEQPEPQSATGLPVLLVGDWPGEQAPHHQPEIKKRPTPTKPARPAEPPSAEAASAPSTGFAAFNLAGPGGYEMCLDGAKLRLLRGEDLLSLTFKFRGLKLIGTASQHPYIVSSQDAYACKTKSPEALLIVEFPPQHVAEEAFFRLTETTPPNISEADFRQLVTRDPAAALAKVAAALAALSTNLPDVPIDRNDVSTQGIPQGPTFNDKFNDKVEALKDAQSPDYKAFRQQFAAKAATAGLTGPEAVYYGGQMPRSSAQDATQATQATQVYILVQLLTPATTAPAPGSDLLKAIARARLSGPSRLVFDLPCRDGTGGKRKLLDFTADALTNWSAFDLKVVRRAERYIEVDKKGNKQAVTDLAKILDFQFFKTNEGWAERLQEIVATSSAAPSDEDTAIELPFRLFLSPAQDARFRTPPAVLGRMPAEGRSAVLWHAELDEGVNGAGLRAVWSPDYAPGWFAKDPAAVPDAGPYPPWQPTRKLFRTSLSSSDRHQLVALSSVYGMPVLARKPDAATTSGDVPRPRPSNFQPPDGYAIIGPDIAHKDPQFFTEQEGIYVPPPLDVSELTLTALGGSLTLDTRFEPPAAPYLKKDSSSLFNAFSLERWKHQTVLGRDISVEVVYKGFLYPLGNRASLVKLTERRFLANPEGQFPTAYLIQRMFIRIGKPDKTYPAIGEPFDGRDFPVSESYALTKRTPDILDPTTDATAGPAEATANGRLQLAAGTIQGLAFWPRTAPSLGAEVIFKFQIDGGDGAMQMPLLFVDNTAVHDPPSMALIADYYEKLRDNTNPAIKNLCTAQHSGAKRRYAPETKSGEATFETDRWIFAVRGRLINQQDNSQQSAGQPSGGQPGGGQPAGGTPAAGPPAGPQPNRSQQDFTMDSAMEGQDQPPFYPWLFECFVKLRQVDNFTGNSSSWVGAGFAEIYVRSGFASQNPSELYLQLIDQVSLDVSQSGDRSGGVAKPNGMVLGLSRKLGPLTGRQAAAPASTPPAAAPAAATPAPTPPAAAPAPAPPLMQVGLPALAGLAAAQSGRFDPSEFFGGALSEAKLLGLLPLKDLIKIAGIAAAPVLKETFSYATSQAVDDSEAAMAAVRDAITSAAKTLLDAIQTFQDNAERGLQSVAPDVAPPRLAWLYTGLSQALTAFQIALKADDLKSNDPNTLFAAVSTAIEAGSQVTDQAQAIATNPTPVFIQDAIATFTTAYGALRAWPDAIKNQLIANVRQAAVAQLRDVLCSDQSMFAIAVFGPAMASACTQLDPANPQAISTFVAVLQQAVKAEAEDYASAEEQDILQTGEAMFFDAVAVPLFNVLNQLQALQDAAAQNATALGEQVVTLIGQVFDVADAIALAPAIQKAIGDAQAACGQTAQFFDAAIKALGLPNTDQIQSAAQSLQASFADLATLETNLRSQLSQANLPDTARQQTTAALDAVTRMRTGCGAGVDRLAKTIIDALNARDKVAGTVASQLCTSLLQRDSFQSTQLLFALRRRAIVETHDLFGKLAGALDPSVPQAPSATPGTPASTGAALPATPLPAAAPPAPAGPTDLATATQSIVSTLSILFKEVTGLAGRLDPGDAQYDMARAGWIDSLDQTTGNLATKIEAAGGDAVNIASNLRKHLKDMQTAGKALAKRWPKDLQPSTNVRDLANGVLAFATVAADAGAFSQNQERQLMAQAAAAITVQGLDIGKVETAVAAIVKPALDIIIQINTTVSGVLGPVYTWLQGLKTTGQSDSFVTFFKPAAGQTFDQIISLFNPKPVDDDTASLQAAGTALANGDLQGALSGLKTLRNGWKKMGGPAVIQIAANVGAVANKLLHGKLTDYVDLGAFANAIEQALLSFIPVQYDLKYDFNTEIGDLGDLFTVTDADSDRRTEDARGHKERDLVISAHLTVNLLDPTKKSLTINGTLQPFDVELLPQLNAVTLSFAPATFTSTDLSKPKFDVKVTNVEIGPALSFLADLGSFLSPKGGNGFFITPQWSPPGIEAGFGIDLGTISLGEVSFLNVSLGASCELPFDDRPAQFYVNLSRRDAPFMISALPFGGGGFFALIATTKGVVGFEASFEGGFVAAFSYGPLDAEGRVCLGIYVAKNDTSAQISGYFFAGGSAHIACFAVSAALLVSFEQDNGGAMQGQATFTFTFSVGLCDFSYSVGVAHSVGSGFSGGVNSTGLLEDDTFGPKFADDAGEPSGVKLAMLGDEPRSDSTSILTGTIARPRASSRPAAPARRKTSAVSRNAVSMTSDWTIYRTYFDNDL
jgi:hypothetical protein